MKICGKSGWYRERSFAPDHRGGGFFCAPEIEIGGNSFGNNANSIGKLSFIKLPNSLEKISANSFVVNDLEFVIIPDSVTTLEPGVFSNNNMTEYIIGKGVTELPSSLFANNEIKHAVIPDHITKIQGTFIGNPIEKITFGTGLVEIGPSTFSNYSGNKYHNQNFLTEVYIPKNIIKIGTEVFKNATNDVIIRTERTKEDFLANVSVTAYGYNNGSAWHGKAQVISSDGLSIY